jgi:hypothetical protein
MSYAFIVVLISLSADICVLGVVLYLDLRPNILPPHDFQLFAGSPLNRSSTVLQKVNQKPKYVLSSDEDQLVVNNQFSLGGKRRFTKDATVPCFKTFERR